MDHIDNRRAVPESEAFITFGATEGVRQVACLARMCLKSTGTMVYRYHHVWIIASGFVLCLLLGCADSTPNINKLLRAAEQGDAEAQFEMGDMYREGESVEADDVEAAKWLSLAADQGHAGAQFALGIMYYNGEGVPEDEQEAIQRWQKAADQGYGWGHLWLAFLYDSDDDHYVEADGIDEDDVEASKRYTLAAQSFRKAAKRGDVRAQYGLGLLYAYGYGVPEDKEEAAKWIRKAAKQGQTDAQYNLGIMYAYGYGVPDDDEEAARWYRKAADQGNASAIRLLQLRSF